MSKAKAKAATKSAIFTELAGKTELSRKQITMVFDELTLLIKKELSPKGPGVFALPGLLKIKRVIKDATPAREGRNPRTGEPMTIKAKPKRTVVRALPLKALKEMVK